MFDVSVSRWKTWCLHPVTNKSFHYLFFCNLGSIVRHVLATVLALGVLALHLPDCGFVHIADSRPLGISCVLLRSDIKMASSSSGDLKCTRCDQRGHIAEDCPHYRFDRPMHQDARTHLGNAPSLEADDGSHWILRDAVESLQPGDGHCMFHSLAAGLAFFDVVISGPALRVEISKWLKSHASVSVAGNTFAEWIYLDSRKSPAEYCSLMERTGEWGGGLELSAFAHCKQIDVHVFERREGVFHRISFIRSPTPTEKEIYVLFVGRCHYDLLVGGSMNEQPISLLGGSVERGGAAASEEHNIEKNLRQRHRLLNQATSPAPEINRFRGRQ